MPANLLHIPSSDLTLKPAFLLLNRVDLGNGCQLHCRDDGWILLKRL